MTTETFAALMKVSEYTVRKWCREGTVPARKIGRRWYVLRAAYGDVL